MTGKIAVECVATFDRHRPTPFARRQLTNLSMPVNKIGASCASHSIRPDASGLRAGINAAMRYPLFNMQFRSFPSQQFVHEARVWQNMVDILFISRPAWLYLFCGRRGNMAFTNLLAK